MKIKKTLPILMLLVFALLPISACSKNDFEYVSSITITTAGETKTFESYYTESFHSRVIDETEYKASKEKDRITYEPYSKSSVTKKTDLPPKEQMGATTYTKYNVKEPTIKYRQYLDGFNRFWFYEIEFKGTFEYSYVQVKIIDNTTLIIKDKNGETTYTVTSYSITHLE